MKLSSALAFLLAAEGVRAFSILPTRHTLAQISGPKGAAAPLYGLLDEINSDDYSLMDTSDESEINMNDAYEMFLGDLVFSTNDPRIDIVNNYERATDGDFLGWLEKKIENSTDPEERPALKDLYEIIVDVKKRTDLSNLAKEREAREAGLQEQQRMEQADADAEAGLQMSNTDVLRKAMSIDSAKSEEDLPSNKVKKTFYEEELTPEIRLSYEDQVKKFLPPYQGGESAQSVVFSNYERFDAQFVKVLTERSISGEEDSTALLEALAEEQRKRISTAIEALKSVLSMGEPMKMEGAIVRLARDGKIDESFLLLLEANETQARDAGATGPAELMKKLKKRAAEEKDKQMSSKEIRLIRKLLRADDAQEREQILEDAFTPQAGLLVAGTPENAQKALDGEQPDQDKPMPDVPPPDFINACKAVMLNFGNLAYDDDRGDLASRIKQMASEAEVVATRIYGQGMSLREQQDQAWSDSTTSIFDLERMELEAEAAGEHAAWTNPDASDDDMMLPGFGADGKMKIGGI